MNARRENFYFDFNAQEGPRNESNNFDREFGTDITNIRSKETPFQDFNSNLSLFPSLNRV